MLVIIAAVLAFVTVAGLGLVLYYPLHLLFDQYQIINIFTVILIALIVTALGGLVGWFWGGLDRWQNVRTGAITGFVVILILLFIALASVLDIQIGHADPKKLLVNLVMVALVINFSFFIT